MQVAQHVQPPNFILPGANTGAHSPKRRFSEYSLLYRPEYARLFDDVPVGLFLSLFQSWEGKQRNRQGWIYKSQQQITKESGLSRTQTARIRKKLCDAGLMQEERRRTPATLHFRFNWSAIHALVGAPSVSNAMIYRAEFARAFGSTAIAVFLALFESWQGLQRDRQGWIFKTQKQIAKESGLSRAQIEHARALLIDAGLMQETKRGIPRRLYFRFRWNSIFKRAEIADFSEIYQCAENLQTECGKPANCNAENLQTEVRKTCKLSHGNMHGLQHVPPIPPGGAGEDVFSLPSAKPEKPLRRERKRRTVSEQDLRILKAFQDYGIRGQNLSRYLSVCRAAMSRDGTTDEHGTVYAGYSISQIERAIRIFILNGHHKPGALLRTISGAIQPRGQGSANSGPDTLLPAKGSAAAGQILFSSLAVGTPYRAGGHSYRKSGPFSVSASNGKSGKVVRDFWCYAVAESLPAVVPPSVPVSMPEAESAETTRPALAAPEDAARPGQVRFSSLAVGAYYLRSDVRYRKISPDCMTNTETKMPEVAERDFWCSPAG